MRQTPAIGAAGIEWVIEAHGCHSGALAHLPKLRAMFSDIVTAMALRPVGDAMWHQFGGGGGITGLCLLAESHLACHTFPEYQSICLNLFCCQPRPDWDFAAYFKREFSAAAVTVRRIERPYTHERESRELPQLRSPDQVPLV